MYSLLNVGNDVCGLNLSEAFEIARRYDFDMTKD